MVSTQTSVDRILKEALLECLPEPNRVVAALERVRAEAAEDALRYVDAHQDDEGYAGPTPERARLANGSLVKLELENRDNRGIAGIAFAIATPVHKLHLEGRITDAEREAGAKFFADYTIGTSESITGRYGIELAMASVGGSRGTPVSQSTSSRFTRQERRSHHHGLWQSACKALGDERTAQWLTALLAEQTLPGEARPITMGDVGRNFMDYNNARFQSVAGVTLVVSWLRILAVHYGFKNGRR